MSAYDAPMPARCTVHLVDASPYIFRAYFALPDSMRAPDGGPVNAVYGFIGFLLRLFDDEKLTHLGVAFDQSLTTSFRNELYPEYKANRELPPPELEAQQRACREAADALGALTWCHERYEADDLIATACGRLVSGGHSVVVVTSDKDLAQLVAPSVELFDFARGTRYGPDEVLEKFGVRAEQIPDYLGLAGDPVDGIPGVAGVGPKTAAALLGAFHDLDALYANLPRVAELSLRGAKALAAKLEAARELAFLSRELATVARDAPADATLERLAWRGARRELVDPLFERLGFEGVRDRIPKWADGA